jgi:hypothetical protein
MALAFYKVQKKHGKTIEEIGDIIYKATEVGFKSYPKWLLRLSGQKYFSKKYLEIEKKNAEESQKRKYEGDWVTIFVPGDGKSFDYGCDHKECGIVKFFHKQDADELTPYMCKLDFLNSDALDERLIRTSTIAGGETVCDFRFKRGRKTIIFSN